MPRYLLAHITAAAIAVVRLQDISLINTISKQFPIAVLAKVTGHPGPSCTCAEETTCIQKAGQLIVTSSPVSCTPLCCFRLISASRQFRRRNTVVNFATWQKKHGDEHCWAELSFEGNHMRIRRTGTRLCKYMENRKQPFVASLRPKPALRRHRASDYGIWEQ
jgi:hypothetical protein